MIYRNLLRVLLDGSHSDGLYETEESPVRIDPSSTLAPEGRKVYSEPNTSDRGSGTQTWVAPNEVFFLFTANMDSIVTEQKKDLRRSQLPSRRGVAEDEKLWLPSGAV